MPPKNKPAPNRAQRERLVEWIQTTLTAVDCKIKDPGQITLHRLNRAEYNNTIRDLVGVDFKPAADFPSDDVGYGFDNIGDVLSISPLLIEKYFNAAEQITEKAIVVPDVTTVRFNADRLDGDNDNGDGGGNVLLGVTGSTASVEYDFAKDGDYLFRVRAFGQQFGPEPAQMSLRLDGKELRLVDVTAVEKAPQNFEETINIKAGNTSYRRFIPTITKWWMRLTPKIAATAICWSSILKLKGRWANRNCQNRIGALFFRSQQHRTAKKPRA